MMNEKKDEQLNRAFDEYFDGGEMPAVDLARAKSELAEAGRRNRRKRRTVAALSACASLVLVVAVGIAFPFFLKAGAGQDMAEAPAAPSEDLPNSSAPAAPDDNAQSPASPEEPGRNDGDVSEAYRYSLSQTSSRSMSYAAFSAAYGELAEEFAEIETAEGITCSYTVYAYGGRDVLLGASVSAEGFTATVYADLSGGTYVARDFYGFSSFPEADGYRASVKMQDGAYVSSVYWVKNTERFATVNSPTENGAEELMKYFLK